MTKTIFLNIFRRSFTDSLGDENLKKQNRYILLVVKISASVWPAVPKVLRGVESLD